MTNNKSTDMVTGSAHLDLAGNLIIKARFNNNFKKTTINNDELTYDELILMLQRLFNGRFDAKDDVKLKYRDEDGDLVDIDNDSDLKSAIQSNRYLKLVISLGDELEDDVSLLDDKISLSKKEFRKLTETMERILENLKTNVSNPKPENSTNSSFEPLNAPLNNEAPVSHALNNLTLSDSKEFDPLVVNNKTDDLKSDKSTIQASLEDDSIKSLNSASEHQPATLQPSAQQFQSTQNLQTKILNQSQQFQQPPNLQNPMSNQPPTSSAIHGGHIQPPPQHVPSQQGHPSNQPPMPYRPQLSGSSQTFNAPYGMPATSRPSNFNPNELQNNPPQFNPNQSHPSSYPTPSSTPANTFTPPQQITSPPGPPQLSGSSQSFNPPYGMTMPPVGPPSSLSGPPTSSMNTAPQSSMPGIQSGPPSAFGPPMPSHQQNPQMNRPPPPPVGPQSSLPGIQSGPPTSLPNNQQQNGTAPPQGPPQFTNFAPPTGPYPGQTPKSAGNPFSGRNSTGNRGYIYPTQPQFN